MRSFTAIDRHHIMSRHPTANRSQRVRRTTNPRIDFYPSPEALTVLRAQQALHRPGSVMATNSAVLNAILEEAGIKYGLETAPMTSAQPPEFLDANARANDFGGRAGTGARLQRTAEQQSVRVPCGARRRRDGLPCEALSVPGKRRCKWHGGCSTGPRTGEGRARSLANLKIGSQPRVQPCLAQPAYDTGWI